MNTIMYASNINQSITIIKFQASTSYKNQPKKKIAHSLSLSYCSNTKKTAPSQFLQEFRKELAKVTVEPAKVTGGVEFGYVPKG